MGAPLGLDFSAASIAAGLELVEGRIQHTNVQPKEFTGAGYPSLSAPGDASGNGWLAHVKSGSYVKFEYDAGNEWYKIKTHCLWSYLIRPVAEEFNPLYVTKTYVARIKMRLPPLYGGGYAFPWFGWQRAITDYGREGMMIQLSPTPSYYLFSTCCVDHTKNILGPNILSIGFPKTIVAELRIMPHPTGDLSYCTARVWLDNAGVITENTYTEQQWPTWFSGNPIGYVGIWLFSGAYVAIDDFYLEEFYEGPDNFPASPLLAEFPTITGAGTLDPSTADIKAFQKKYFFLDGLADSSDLLKIGASIDGGAVTYKTVAEWKAQGAISPTASLAAKGYFNGTGAEQIALSRAMLGTWTPATVLPDSVTPSLFTLTDTGTGETLKVTFDPDPSYVAGDLVEFYVPSWGLTVGAGDATVGEFYVGGLGSSPVTGYLVAKCVGKNPSAPTSSKTATPTINNLDFPGVPYVLTPHTTNYVPGTLTLPADGSKILNTEVTFGEDGTSIVPSFDLDAYELPRNEDPDFSLIPSTVTGGPAAWLIRNVSQQGTLDLNALKLAYAIAFEIARNTLQPTGEVQNGKDIFQFNTHRTGSYTLPTPTAPVIVVGVPFGKTVVVDVTGIAGGVHHVLLYKRDDTRTLVDDQTRTGDGPVTVTADDYGIYDIVAYTLASGLGSPPSNLEAVRFMDPSVPPTPQYRVTGMRHMPGQPLNRVLTLERIERPIHL